MRAKRFALARPRIGGKDCVMAEPATRILIKPMGGIAGDMFAGACAALWPDLVDFCLRDVRAAGLSDGVDVTFTDVSALGFAAKRFLVADGGPVVPTGAYPEIAARLAASELDRTVEAEAQAILHRLAKAEAQVHGKEIDQVHFHELADWDSLADIVAAASFIVRSGVTIWTVDPLPLGGGMVQTQHGRITVPAPAVLALLKGFALHDDGIMGERVTPTGAAIVAHLAQPSAQRLAMGRLGGSGFGAGTKTFPGMANVVQLVAFSSAGVQEIDYVAEMSFDIDDMTGEELGTACDRLRLLDGVLDVAMVPMLGKKGRPASMIRVLAKPEVTDPIMAQIFDQTTTLGIRSTVVQRAILPRTEQWHASYRVKLAERPSGTTAKTEADCLAGDTLSARRDEKSLTEGAATTVAQQEGSNS